MATPGSKKNSPAQKRYTGEKRWEENKMRAIERAKKFNERRADKREDRQNKGKPVRGWKSVFYKKHGHKPEQEHAAE